MIALWLAFFGVSAFALIFGTVVLLRVREIDAEFLRFFEAVTQALELRRDLDEVLRAIATTQSDIRGLTARADINDRGIGDALERLTELDRKVELADILTKDEDDDKGS